MTVRAGDYLCVLAGRFLVDRFIEYGQMLDGFDRTYARYVHVAQIVEVVGNSVYVVEGWPPRARRNVYQLDEPGLIFSGEQVSDENRQKIVDKANSLVGTPYSASEYFAIAAHRLHLPGEKELRDHVQHSGHMICSRLVAVCQAAGGVDVVGTEWDGYCVPAGLAMRCPGV
jgi:uncharacterized protein YycO